jgi:glycerophosphoryl diester phosphodiesterase
MSEGPRNGLPLLLGHRGQRHARRRFHHTPQVLPPDNTLAAFELTLQRGCDGFEFDVRYTHDRRAVICHDPKYRGLTIASTHYDSLRTASPRRDRRVKVEPATADDQMPCLEDVLARFSDRAYLDIEIKIPGFEEEIAGAIRQAPPRRGFVVSSFLPPVLRRFHELDPTLPLGYICKDRNLLPQWRALPVQIVIPHAKLVSHLLVRELHEAGKQVFTWTVNRESEMRRLALWGVDAIISDDTELLVATFAALHT